MEKLTKIISIFFLIPLFSACTETLLDKELMTIKYGSECGWCAGQEYITITSSKIKYERNIPCGDNKGMIEKNRDFNPGEKDSILNSFDYSLFETLEYTNCNVCADGCDEIIQITKNESMHEIRYSFSEEIEGMEDLQEKLAIIMNEMRDLP